MVEGEGRGGTGGLDGWGQLVSWNIVRKLKEQAIHARKKIKDSEAFLIWI